MTLQEFNTAILEHFSRKYDVLSHRGWKYVGYIANYDFDEKNGLHGFIFAKDMTDEETGSTTKVYNVIYLEGDPNDFRVVIRSNCLDKDNKIYDVDLFFSIADGLDDILKGEKVFAKDIE